MASRSSQRDEFSATTIRLLADRAAWRCTLCRVYTIRPSSSDEASAIRFGRAAHICAAAPGGPRYDTAQTSEQRRSIENGIWLCARCGDVIDRDHVSYPLHRLQKAKSDHSKWLGDGGTVPDWPHIRLRTLDGLFCGHDPSSVTPEMVTLFRDQELPIHPTTRHVLHQVKIKLQLPEGINAHLILEKPPGTELTFRALGQEWMTTTGGGVMRVSSPPPRIAVLEIEALFPHRQVRVLIRTSERRTPPQRFTGQEYYLRGTFLYGELGEFAERSFVVPVERRNRSLATGPIEELADQDLVEMLIG